MHSTVASPPPKQWASLQIAVSACASRKLAVAVYRDFTTNIRAGSKGQLLFASRQLAQHRFSRSKTLICVNCRCSRDGQHRGHKESLLTAPDLRVHKPALTACKLPARQTPRCKIRTSRPGGLLPPAQHQIRSSHQAEAAEHVPDAGSHDMVQLNLCAGPGALNYALFRLSLRLEATKLSPRNGESMMRPREQAWASASAPGGLASFRGAARSESFGFLELELPNARSGCLVATVSAGLYRPQASASATNSLF